MRTQSIIMVAMPAGLGGGLSVTLNALNPVLATGSGGVPLRSRPGGSLNVVSIIEDRLVSSLRVLVRPYFCHRDSGRSTRAL